MTTLCKIMADHGSDKSPLWEGSRKPHSYTKRYHELFSGIRESVTSVLEVGVYQGASLRGWREYFPNAQIVGVDNRESRLYQSDRIESFLADQTSGASLQDALGEKTFDIIIDDGIHNWKKNLRTLRSLRKKLRNPGVYIIEDVKKDQAKSLYDSIAYDKESLGFSTISIWGDWELKYDDCLIELIYG